MKYRIVSVILLFVLLISFSVQAMNFNVDEVFDSVVVIYSSGGSGSGFAIDKNLILTNSHVVGSDSSVTVVLYDGTKTRGKVIKRDENIDLAIVSVNEEFTPLVTDASALSVGQDVYAIGAPKDMPYTMTKGIVSSVDRTLGFNKYTQIDASVNSGNSGGPLLNDDGKVIGIITMKISEAEGIGFAVRVADINNFINDIPPQTTEGEEAEPDAGKKSNTPYYVFEDTTVLKLALCLSVFANMGLIAWVICLLCKNRRKNEITESKEYDFEIEIEEL